MIQKDHPRPADGTIGLPGVGWHTFRHTCRTLIYDVGTPLGVRQRLMRHADIKTTMNTYGPAFEKKQAPSQQPGSGSSSATRDQKAIEG